MRSFVFIACRYVTCVHASMRTADNSVCRPICELVIMPCIVVAYITNTTLSPLSQCYHVVTVLSRCHSVITLSQCYHVVTVLSTYHNVITLSP